MKTLIIFFTFSVLIYAQHDSYYQWKDMNYHERMLFIEGVTNGIPLGGMFATHLLNKSERKNLVNLTIIVLMNI